MKKVGANWLPASCVRSETVSKREKWLGYLVGPAGALFLNAVLVLCQVRNYKITG